LVLWGLADTALPSRLLEGLDEHVHDLTLVRLPDATHWVIHEQPERLAAEIGRFIA
jgi:pimeloyl-ACP methyl ester carboxylesterase